jgi:hypothetical protein
MEKREGRRFCGGPCKAKREIKYFKNEDSWCYRCENQCVECGFLPLTWNEEIKCFDPCTGPGCIAKKKLKRVKDLESRLLNKEKLWLRQIRDVNPSYFNLVIN